MQNLIILGILSVIVVIGVTYTVNHFKGKDSDEMEEYKMCIVIQRASAADAEEVLEYLKKAGGETDNLTFGSEGLPVTVEEEIEYLKQLEKSSDDVMFVAKDDGKIVGDISLQRLPRRMSHRGDLGIAVLKEHWNQGIGSRLMSEMLRFAKESGIEVIDLQVRSDNTAAIHMYEKFGFQKIGMHPSFFRIDQEDIPFHYMCLQLKKTS